MVPIVGLFYFTHVFFKKKPTKNKKPTQYLLSTFQRQIKYGFVLKLLWNNLMKYHGRVKGYKTCVTNSTWIVSFVLSKVNGYFWGVGGRRERMEKGGVGGRMDG